MDHAPTTSHADADGVLLHIESTGSGTPIVLVHELAGDQRNWAPQVAYFTRSRRCVTFNARGYPPSDVPDDIAGYSQAYAVEDIGAVLRHLGLRQAHLVGLSMGGYAVLNFAIAHPEQVISVVAAGTGHGSDPSSREEFLTGSAALADGILEHGLAAGGAAYLQGATRRRFAEKDPEGFRAFNRQFADHSALGTALTIRGCQLRRPTLQDLAPDLAALTVPILVIAGGDDTPCVTAGLFLQQTIPDARLCVLPRATHTVNLEEPDAFNRIVGAFLDDVERAREG